MKRKILKTNMVRTRSGEDDGFYIFPEDFEEALLGNSGVDEVFYLRELKQRKMYVDGNISQGYITDYIRHILQFNREDANIPPEQRKPIIIYITSNGGDVDAGFELIDAIQMSKTPVYTVNLGFQYSMGFLIGLAGDKRFGTKNAKYLLHDGSNFLMGSGTKVRDQMKFQNKVEERIRDFVLSRSNVTAKEYNSKLRVEWYMFADEAKERGFVDYIIGEDCEIDDII